MPASSALHETHRGHAHAVLHGCRGTLVWASICGRRTGIPEYSGKSRGFEPQGSCKVTVALQHGRGTEAARLGQAWLVKTRKGVKDLCRRG